MEKPTLKCYQDERDTITFVKRMINGIDSGLVEIVTRYKDGPKPDDYEEVSVLVYVDDLFDLVKGLKEG